MRAVVNKYLGVEKFIEYREVGSFADELDDCLLQIEHNQDALFAMDCAFFMLEQAIEAFQYADDSNGDIGSLV